VNSAPRCSGHAGGMAGPVLLKGRGYVRFPPNSRHLARGFANAIVTDAKGLRRARPGGRGAPAFDVDRFPGTAAGAFPPRTWPRHGPSFMLPRFCHIWTLRYCLSKE
jgi:hypothetical protein